jgi:hypothetical protein
MLTMPRLEHIDAIAMIADRKCWFSTTNHIFVFLPHGILKLGKKLDMITEMKVETCFGDTRLVLF